MKKKIVRSAVFEKPKGLYQVRGVWWYQAPQINTIRPKPVSLQTHVYLEAIAKRQELLEVPHIALSDSVRCEFEKHIKRKLAARVFTIVAARCKQVTVRNFSRFLPRGITLPDITTRLLQDYYDQRRGEVSVASSHKAIMDVRSFLNDMVEQKKVRSNAAIGVKEEQLPHSPRIKFIPRELRDSLIANCECPDMKLILLFGTHAGLRKNEIVQARPEWVRMEGAGFLCLTDTETHRFNRKKKGRTIPMTKELRAHFEEHGIQEPFLVRPDVRQGKPGCYRWDFRVPFMEYIASQKGPEWITPHVMRHTFASLLVMDNKSVYKVAKWMGDLVSTVEDVYGHLSPEDQDVNVSSPTPVAEPMANPAGLKVVAS